MTQLRSVPDAVLFLSPAQLPNGLPPELDGPAKASPIERMSARLRREGFVRLRLVALEEDQGPNIQPEQVRARLQEIGETLAAEGIALRPETVPTLETWLSAQPPELDWIVCGPDPADCAPKPRGLTGGGALWLERMRSGTAFGMPRGGGAPLAGTAPALA